MGFPLTSHAQLGVEDILVEPACANSFCIGLSSWQMGQNEMVDFNDVPSHFSDLSDEVACSALMADVSGVTVLKQFPGEVRPFTDSFCTLQGCIGNFSSTTIGADGELTEVINPCI